MSFKATMIKAAYTGMLMVKKNSPTILTVSGIVLGIGSTVLAVKATTHISDIESVHAENIEKIERNRKVADENPDEMLYTQNEEDADRQVVYFQTVFAYGRLYAPAAFLAIAGIACTLGAHNIMNNRMAATAAALTSMTSRFSKYREAVVANEGEQSDHQYLMISEGKEVPSEIDPENKVVEKPKSNKDFLDAGNMSRFFDEFSPFWDKYNKDLNVITLRNNLRTCNDQLNIRGHLFLNEVYDILGIDRTPTGSVMGWIKNKDHPTSFVDFGVFNGDDNPWDFDNNLPWDGTNGILLNFNVDGVIYDLI